MIKKIRIEVILFILVLTSIYFTYNFDLVINSFFSKLNYGYGEEYLKDFFNKITKLGDSLWYFLIFLVTLITSYFFKKINKYNYNYLRRLSIFCLSYLVTVGVFTQLIKHIVGRPRPNYTNIEGGIVFNSFSTDAIFHSFPSGHSSTIISVTLIFTMIFPKLKIFFYICGFLVSISRVVNGAHFFTDVIGGGLLAILIFKIVDVYFKKYYPKISANNFKIKKTSVLSKVNICFCLLAVFITVASSLDIYVSSLFYYISPKSFTTIFGTTITTYDYSRSFFLLQSYYFVSIVFREIFLPVLVIYIFILPILSIIFPIKIIYFNYVFTYKDIFFIWISGVITLIIIVNGLLKGLWGRSRPNDILNFGGNEFFTPWYKFGDTCLSNCSFVSGDSSVGFTILVFYFIIKKNIFCYFALFSGVVLGFIRIIAGGHFFSDIVFSQLLVTTSIFVSFVLYKKLYDK